jgi:hypothetical protein
MGRDLRGLRGRCYCATSIIEARGWRWKNTTPCWNILERRYNGLHGVTVFLVIVLHPERKLIEVCEAGLYMFQMTKVRNNVRAKNTCWPSTKVLLLVAENLASTVRVSVRSSRCCKIGRACAPMHSTAFQVFCVGKNVRVRKWRRSANMSVEHVPTSDPTRPCLPAIPRAVALSAQLQDPILLTKKGMELKIRFAKQRDIYLYI